MHLADRNGSGESYYLSGPSIRLKKNYDVRDPLNTIFV